MGILDNLKIRNKLLLGFGTILIIFFAGLTAIYISAETLNTNNDDLRTHLSQSDDLNVIIELIDDVNINVDDYINSINPLTGIVVADNFAASNSINSDKVLLLQSMLQKFLTELNIEDLHVEKDKAPAKTAKSEILTAIDEWLADVDNIFGLPNINLLSSLFSSGSHVLHIGSILPTLVFNYALTGSSDYKNEIGIHLGEFAADISALEGNLTLVKKVSDSYHTTITEKVTTITQTMSTLNATVITQAISYGDDQNRNQTEVNEWVKNNGFIFIDDLIDKYLHQFNEYILSLIDLSHEISNSIGIKLLQIDGIVGLLKQIIHDELKQVIQFTEDQIVLNRIIVLISFIIPLLASVFIIYTMDRKVARNIVGLSKNMEKSATGDFTIDTTENKILSGLKSNGDEIGTLTNSYVHMIDNIRLMISNTQNTAEIIAKTSNDLLSGSEEINASSEEVASTSQAMSNGATTQTELVSVVNEKIVLLSEVIDDIINKIHTNTQEVSQISLQTNILALNAGIEASRAGDYGRGFAVVAENIRRLSEQSKFASQRIENVAEDIKAALQESFEEISSAMITVVSVSEETAASAEEVAAAAEQMTASIQEMTSTTYQMSMQSEKSHDLIGQFKI